VRTSVTLLPACVLALNYAFGLGAQAGLVMETPPAPRAWESGCASFRVRLSADRRTILADSIAVAGCTGVLRPQLASTTELSFDGSSGTLALPLRIANSSGTPITAPARIYVTIDSVQSASPTSSATSCSATASGCVTVANADTAAAASAGLRLDAFLATPGDPQIVEPGSSSVTRAAQLRVAPSVTGFRLVIRALARQGALVPERPPAQEPQWALHDSAFVHGASSRGIVVVLFRPKADQAERQQAVDLVGATVVGGTRLHTGDGFYDLYIPEAASEASLDAIITRLEALPQVQGAATMVPGVAGS
jgi:hypothetical protein